MVVARGRASARQTMIFATVGFAVAFALNVWVMADFYDGFRTPAGTPATGDGNYLMGTLFYMLASALITSVISYRLAVGPERFGRDLRAIPRDIRRALTDDAGRTSVHLLAGLGLALLLAAVTGPSISAVLAIAAILAFLPIVRPIVSGLIGMAFRRVVSRLAPTTPQPPTVGMLVGVTGSAAGFAVGWQLSTGPVPPLVIGIVAIGAAAVLARSGKGGVPGAGTVGGGGAAVILLAAGLGTFAALLGFAGLALADDGGFKECGSPALLGWLTNCAGSGGVVQNSLLGGAAAGAGAAAGSAIGSLAGPEEGTEPGTGTEPGQGTEPAQGTEPSGPGDKPGGTDDSGSVPGVGGKNPFDLEKIKLEDINWDLMPDEMRERIRQQLIHDWRTRNPGADYIRQQQAGQEIDAMLTGDGPIKQWMREGWEFAKDSATLTWEDFKSGQALMSIIGTAEGMVDGLKTGAIGLKDMVVNAPQMVGVAIEFWSGQNPASSVRQIMAEVPGMTTEMAHQFLGLMKEIEQASLSGDNQRVGQILGKIAGQAEFEVLMGIGSLKAVELGKDMVQSTRLTRAVESVADDIPAPKRPGAGSVVDIDNPGPLRRPTGEEVNVRQLEGDFGYDSFTGEFIDAKAKQHGVLIEMKPANPESLNMIKNGEALAKPESLKPKTTSNLDLEIGAPPGSEGKVTFFEPKKPANFDSLPKDHPLVERYNTRQGQWEKYQTDMAELQKPVSERSPAFQDAMRRQYGTDVPLEIEIKGGVIYDKTTGKPFTGDYDIWAVRDAKTGELVDTARAQAVYDDMGYAFNPQHGPGTAHWQPADPYLQKLKTQLEWEHNPSNPNAANLLQFNGNGLPTTTWNVPK
jgi:hypothetical protein